MSLEERKVIGPIGDPYNTYQACQHVACSKKARTVIDYNHETKQAVIAPMRSDHDCCGKHRECP